MNQEQVIAALAEKYPGFSREVFDRQARALAERIDRDYGGSIVQADRYAISFPWWFDAWKYLGRDAF